MNSLIVGSTLIVVLVIAFFVGRIIHQILYRTQEKIKSY